MSPRLTRPSLPSLVGSVVVSLLVWVTVGVWAASAAVVLLVWDQLSAPGREVLANAALGLVILIPVVWLLGSTLPLSPPSPRLQDNVAAHQLGGLAIWMLCVAAWRDISPLERAQHDL